MVSLTPNVYSTWVMCGAAFRTVAMALNAKQRRELSVRGHRLKPAATVSGDAVSDRAVAHVRQLLVEQDLVKIRIHADSRQECERAAAELAAQVPCEVVTRVGRVVLLYRGPGGDEVPAVL